MGCLCIFRDSMCFVKLKKKTDVTSRISSNVIFVKLLSQVIHPVHEEDQNLKLQNSGSVSTFKHVKKHIEGVVARSFATSRKYVR